MFKTPVICWAPDGTEGATEAVIAPPRPVGEIHVEMVAAKAKKDAADATSAEATATLTGLRAEWKAAVADIEGWFAKIL